MEGVELGLENSLFSSESYLKHGFRSNKTEPAGKTRSAEK